MLAETLNMTIEHSSSAKALPKEGFDFPKVLQLYEAPLLRYAKRLLVYSKYLPEDAVQDVFMRLHKQVQEQGSSSIADMKNWLFRVTYNICMDILRREKTEKNYTDEQIQQIKMAEEQKKDDLTDQHIQKEEYKIALNILDSLEDLEKQVLVLKLLEGLKNIEIAGILSIPESNVSYWLQKGLKSVSLKMKQKELL